RPRLQLTEQSRVLNRDHRLISKCLEERNFHWREGTSLRARDPDGADGLPVTEHGSRENGAHPTPAPDLPDRLVLKAIRLGVGDMDDGPLDNAARGRGRPMN